MYVAFEPRGDLSPRYFLIFVNVPGWRSLLFLLSKVESASTSTAHCTTWRIVPGTRYTRVLLILLRSIYAWYCCTAAVVYQVLFYMSCCTAVVLLLLILRIPGTAVLLAAVVYQVLFYIFSCCTSTAVVLVLLILRIPGTAVPLLFSIVLHIVMLYSSRTGTQVRVLLYPHPVAC